MHTCYMTFKQCSTHCLWMTKLEIGLHLVMGEHEFDLANPKQT